MPYNTQVTQIPVGVCSEDGVNFEIRAGDCNMIHSQTVTRNGNTLPAVTFSPFAFQMQTGDCCEGSLTISGTLGNEAGEVRLDLLGENIASCIDNYYGPTSFNASVEVRLVISGSCPSGLPNWPVA